MNRTSEAEPFSLVVKDLCRDYRYTGGVLHVLKGVSFTVSAGESEVIRGPSGAGKSTLLNIIGSLDSPTSGTVFCGDTDVAGLEGKHLAEYRNRQVGFIFQDHHLLPQCTALENVLLPTIPSRNAADMKERAEHLLIQMGMKERIAFYPARLSGGERQRIAVARALINSPMILLCDEPTGNLDTESSRNVMSLIEGIGEERDVIIITVTHNRELSCSGARRFELNNGILEESR